VGVHILLRDFELYGLFVMCFIIIFVRVMLLRELSLRYSVYMLLGVNILLRDFGLYGYV
jgi:hypothetical protein